MTPVILLDQLAEFVEKCTRDIILQCRTRNDPGGEKERPAEVYRMRLPKKDDEVQRIPYILLQVISGEDDQKAGEPAAGECKIRIIVATYSEDGGQGATDVLNVILRIRAELGRIGIIGEQFDLRYPLEYIVYPDNTPPYYLGEMMTTWGVPAPQREKNIWQ